MERTQEHMDEVHDLVTRIAALPLSKQDRLGITILAAGQFVGGAAAILNHIARDKGKPQLALNDAADAVMQMILKELRSDH